MMVPARPMWEPALRTQLTLYYIFYNTDWVKYPLIYNRVWTHHSWFHQSVQHPARRPLTVDTILVIQDKFYEIGLVSAHNKVFIDNKLSTKSFYKHEERSESVNSPSVCCSLCVQPHLLVCLRDMKREVGVFLARELIAKMRLSWFFWRDIL